MGNKLSCDSFLIKCTHKIIIPYILITIYTLDNKNYDVKINLHDGMKKIIMIYQDILWVNVHYLHHYHIYLRK